MPRRYSAYLWCLALWALPAFGAGEIAAIAYHDIVVKRGGDPYAVTLEDFERQMDYLARNGYRVISLRTLDEVRRGRGALPAKPVLLTFDDGLKSFYRQAYPVLRRYGYPSVVSVVTAWTDGRSTPESYSGGFMSWDELRELSRAGDVEVLSHTDDLHRGVVSNPAASLLPAATARIYDAPGARYETEGEHERRVRLDLRRSVERLKAELGRAPIGITWPYGEYDAVLVDTAAELGMAYHLTLGIEPARLDDLPRINRIALRHYRSLADFADALTHRAYRRQQLRFVELDLGPFSGKDREGQEQLLSHVLRRLELLRVNAVVINPFTADGTRAFFYNGAIPVEADILSRITQQLTGRTNVSRVYLRLPPLADSVRAAVYTDLARLNWFNGAIVDGLRGAPLAAARTLLRAYRPYAQIGAAGDALDDVDVRLVELSADAPARALTQRAAEILRTGPRALFLLRRSGATSERTLRAAMQALRAAGAAHYGYGPDDVLNDTPSVIGMVRDLNEYTIADGSR